MHSELAARSVRAPRWGGGVHGRRTSREIKALLGRQRLWSRLLARAPIWGGAAGSEHREGDVQARGWGAPSYFTYRASRGSLPSLVVAERPAFQPFCYCAPQRAAPPRAREAMNWAAKDRSEIALNTIWSEHVEKESKILKRSIKTTYTCNPCASIPMNNGLGMRMASVTEKVGYAVGLEPVEIGEDPDVNAVVSGLLGAQKVPTEKYSEPITSAQEVGWYSKPLVAANPRFVHGLKQAEATEVRRCITHGNRLFPVPSSVPGDLRRSDTCTCLLFHVLMLNPRSLLKHTQRRWQGSTCFMARVANTSGFRLWTSSLPSLSTGIRLQLQPHSGSALSVWWGRRRRARTLPRGSREHFAARGT